MTLLRRTPLVVAMLSWVGAHVVFAALTLRDSSAPVLTASALALGVGACLGVLAPLRAGRATLGGATAVVVATAAPVVGVVNGVTTGASALVSYAQWWPGLVVPVVAGLVIRRRPWHGALSAAACSVVLGVVMAQRLGAPWLAPTAALGSYFPLWFVGGLLISRSLDRSLVELRRSKGLTSAAVSREHSAAGTAALREGRQALLEQHAVPVLQVIAAGGPVDADLRARAGAAEAALRFELAGRDLLDEAVRTACTAARDRGVAASILDDGGQPLRTDRAALVRRVVTVALAACDDGDLTARRPAGREVSLTIVHVGSPASVTAVGEALLRTAADVSGLVVHIEVDSVVAELRSV